MFRIYISHSIRGIKGTDATPEDMAANNVKAIEFTRTLKVMFPKIDFYCPGEHDEFVCIAFQDGMLTDTQILDVDCKIIDDRDMVLAWIPDQHVSNGMLIEAVYASMAGKTVTVAKTVEQARDIIHTVLERCKR